MVMRSEVGALLDNQVEIKLIHVTVFVTLRWLLSLLDG
jgi:hypothetical protein